MSPKNKHEKVREIKKKMFSLAIVCARRGIFPGNPAVTADQSDLYLDDT